VLYVFSLVSEPSCHDDKHALDGQQNDFFQFSLVEAVNELLFVEDLKDFEGLKVGFTGQNLHDNLIIKELADIIEGCFENVSRERHLENVNQKFNYLNDETTLSLV